MSLFVDALRKARMQPLIKGAARSLGYELWPMTQHPPTTWLGLKALPIRTVLDIGAFDGGLARDFVLPAFPAATVHCFEPSPRTFPRLVETARRSGGRIVAHNLALGETAGQTSFNVTVDGLASSSILMPTTASHAAFPHTRRTEAVTVEVRTLDEVAPTLTPPIADDLFIKMDVQGFEDRVIRGGRKSFARARACVMEVQRAKFYDGQPTFRNLFLMMDELGFEYAGNLDQAHGPSGEVLFFDAMFLRRERSGD